MAAESKGGTCNGTHSRNCSPEEILRQGAESDPCARRHLVSGHAGRVSRHHGQQRLRQIDAAQLGIATVIAPTAGAVALHGKCVTTLYGKALADYRGKEIGYLFQNFELIDNLTGRENILLPLALHGVSEAESRERLTKLADYLEVTDVLDKFPAQMSGGQKQRIAAARALILDPEIVLADEPTGALDSKNARSLMEKLSGLNADAGTTILMVTHDCNAASYCKRILFIQDGVLFHELRRDVPDETQQAFYGRILSVMAQLGGGSANVL